MPFFLFSHFPVPVIYLLPSDTHLSYHRAPSIVEGFMVFVESIVHITLVPYLQLSDFRNFCFMFPVATTRIIAAILLRFKSIFRLLIC
jgi:hypothetical protein